MDTSEEDSWDTSNLTEKIERIQIQESPQMPSMSRNEWGDEQDGGSYSAMENVQTIKPMCIQDVDTEDSVLESCMENTSERMTLFKFEDEIIRFLKNPSSNHLKMEPMPSFHRLIVHRLAERCGLERQSSEMHEVSGDTTSLRSITLIKTQHSVIPSTLYIDMASGRQVQAQKKAPKIMMKRRGNDKRATRQTNDKTTKAEVVGSESSKTMQDREKAYAAARARIFGTESSPSPKESKKTIPPANSAHAAGPDGTRGFSAGRGGGKSPEPVTQSIRVKKQESQPSEPRWNESKVKWRNRMEDMNDPDFARNYDMYRPVYPPYTHGQMIPPYSSPMHASGTPLPPQQPMYPPTAYGHPAPPAMPYNASTYGSRRENLEPRTEQSRQNVVGTPSYNEDFPPLG